MRAGSWAPGMRVPKYNLRVSARPVGGRHHRSRLPTGLWISARGFSVFTAGGGRGGGGSGPVGRECREVHTKAACRPGTGTFVTVSYQAYGCGWAGHRALGRQCVSAGPHLHFEVIDRAAGGPSYAPGPASPPRRNHDRTPVKTVQDHVGRFHGAIRLRCTAIVRAVCGRRVSSFSGACPFAMRLSGRLPCG